jgi:hypothetical protein
MKSNPSYLHALDYTTDQALWDARQPFERRWRRDPSYPVDAPLLLEVTAGRTIPESFLLRADEVIE